MTKDQESDLKYLGEFRSQFFANPAISLCLTICLFSMAGKIKTRYAQPCISFLGPMALYYTK